VPDDLLVDYFIVDKGKIRLLVYELIWKCCDSCKLNILPSIVIEMTLLPHNLCIDFHFFIIGAIIWKTSFHYYIKHYVLELVKK
jgi:hypothetical protein